MLDFFALCAIMVCMNTSFGKKLIAFIAAIALFMCTVAFFATAERVVHNTVASAAVVSLDDETPTEDTTPGDDTPSGEDDPNSNPDEENPTEGEEGGEQGGEQGGENTDPGEPAVPMDTSIKTNIIGIVVLGMVVVCALFALILTASDKNKGSSVQKAPKKKKEKEKE